MLRIALATCRDLPDHEVDDAPLPAAFARVGIATVPADWEDPALDWASFDACLIRTTWNYMDRRDAFVAWADRVAAVTPLFNPAPVVRWNTHKSYLADLAAAGVPVVPTVWAPRGERLDVRAALAERGWRRGFVKPAIGATSRETLRFDADRAGLAAAQSHVDRLLATEDLLLQPYLETVETAGELSMIFVDGAMTHAVRKIPVAGDYRTQDDFGAADEPATVTDDERALAERALAAAGPGLLYGRADFLRNGDGGLVLTELEIVEPSMFLRHCPQAADRLAEALGRRLA